MNKILVQFTCLLVLLLCFSCNKNNRKASNIFSHVENIIEEYPDSALNLLRSIGFPEELNDNNYANYLLLYVKAKDKSGKSIAGDTLIRVSVNYFSNVSKKDNQQAALAHFYFGRVLYQQENYEKATLQALLAEDYAEKVQDDNLLGLIHYDLGNLYDKQFNNELALQNYKESQDFFLKAGNKKNANHILGYIGNMFLQQKPQQVDSAFHCYDQVIRYAEERRDTLSIIDGLSSKAIAYREIGDYVRAKEFLCKAIAIDRHNERIISNSIALAKIYVSLNLPDSAICYMEKSYPGDQENSNYAKLCNYYDLKSKINVSMSDYEQALENALKSTDYLALYYESMIDQSILDIQEKYRAEQLKNSLQETELRQRFLVIVILSILLGSILLASFFIIKINKNREKIKQIEQNLEVMNEMLSEYSENKNSLRDILLEQLDLAKKIAQINKMPSNNARNTLKDNYFATFGKNISDKLDWNNLYLVIDSLYDGFTKKIKNKFPELSEKELQMCCLFRADFKAEEITILQGYDNLDSTYSQKNKLRKKLGFSRMKEFLDFLKKL